MDFEMILFFAFAEIMMDEESSDALKELRLAALKKLQRNLRYYQSLGYISHLTTAIAEKKCQMIKDATSKTQIESFIKPRCPHYDGSKFVEDPTIVPEEELICWSHTSLRAPLNSIGAARFKEVFQRVFPNGVNAEVRRMRMSELTFADLRVHFGTGRAYTISGKGRDRVMGYRVGMQCNLGDIEVSEWIAKVKELIVQTGEQELYEQLHTHMKEHNYTKATKSELEQQVLELHAARIFDNQLWVDFIPFNKRFRPEVLRTVKLVSVIPECCKKAGFLTEARYRERDPNCDENFCPHCGRWTKISLVDNQSPKGELL